MGNTCYISSAVQCLCAVYCFRNANHDANALTRVLHGTLADVQSVSAMYKWCRDLMSVKGRTPEDPAELLLKLFDKELNPNMNTSCFQNTRTKQKRCTKCGHLTETQCTEKMLIVTCLPDGPAPVQRAVDMMFGFRSSKPVQTSPVSVASPTVAPVAPRAISSHSRQEVRSGPQPRPIDAPPLSYHSYNKGFAGPPVAAIAATGDSKDSGQHRGEMWYRCDDEKVTLVRLSQAQPYILFYEERKTSGSTDECAPPAPLELQTLALDCDDGRCKSKQIHEIYVCAYEISQALVVHVAVPRRMHCGSIERTLLVDAEIGRKAYDLAAFISRVGSNHYVAYVRKQKNI